MTKINIFKRRIFVTVILISFSSCMTIEPVEVKNVDNFQLKDVLTNPSVQFDVTIHNPNSFGLTLKEFKSTAFLGDKMVSDIFIEKKVHIGANSDISIPFQTKPSLNTVAELMLSGNTSGDVKVEGFLVVKKFIFRKKFPFTVRTKI
ncbi:MAG: LEA type 2 family protein [Bacteroidia bacterium]